MFGLALLSFLFSYSQTPIANTKWNAHHEIPQNMDLIYLFKKDSFFILRPNGRLAETMIFSQKGDSLYIKKITGVTPCIEGAEGWYKIQWFENGKTFSMSNLSDSCRQRANSFTKMTILGRIDTPKEIP